MHAYIQTDRHTDRQTDIHTVFPIFFGDMFGGNLFGFLSDLQGRPRSVADSCLA